MANGSINEFVLPTGGRMPRESTPGAGSDESVQGGGAGDQGGVSRVCVCAGV